MAGAHIRIGDTEVRARAADLAGLDLDPAPLLRDIGEGLLLSVDDRFRAQTGPDGAKWAALSEVTLARRRGISGLILHDSGHMRNDTIAYEVHGRTLLHGTNAIQGAVQQFGAPARSLGPVSPWGDIPARPFIGLSADDEQEIAETALRHLTRLIGG